MTCWLTLWGLFAGALAAGAAPDGPGPENPLALPHEGKSVNGLRLEAEAKFIPERPNWGAPKLETTFTFHNESDGDILLDGFTLPFRLVPSRVGPPDAVDTRTENLPPWCPRPPERSDVIRIPAGGKHTISQWRWCDTIELPRGKSVDGKVVDTDTVQLFRLKKNGQLTVAFLYRSDGAFTAHLQEVLRPGERLWSGRVYSAPVVISVTELHQG